MPPVARRTGDSSRFQSNVMVRSGGQSRRSCNPRGTTCKKSVADRLKRSLSSASSNTSSSSSSCGTESGRYRLLGRIGATMTHSQTGSSSSDSKMDSKNRASRSDDRNGGFGEQRDAQLQRRIHSKMRQSLRPISRQSRPAVASQNERQFSKWGERFSSRMAYNRAARLPFSDLESPSDFDTDRELTPRRSTSDYRQLVTMAARDANSSNRQQPTAMRRSGKRKPSPRPLPKPDPVPKQSPAMGTKRRGRSASSRHTREAREPASHWNENASNHSDIYCFRQQQQQQRQRRPARKQTHQKMQRNLPSEQKLSRIYSGNHTESNILLRRRLNSLRRLQSLRRDSYNLARSRCSDEERRTSFYGDDCGLGGGFLNGDIEESLIAAKSQQRSIPEKPRTGRAAETPADWQAATGDLIDVPEQRWCDGVRGRMRETRSHRETLFRCPYMSLSLQTKIYECDKCAAQFFNNLNSSRSRLQNDASQDSGSSEFMSESPGLAIVGKSDRRVRSCRMCAPRS